MSNPLKSIGKVFKKVAKVVKKVLPVVVTGAALFAGAGFVSGFLGVGAGTAAQGGGLSGALLGGSTNSVLGGLGKAAAGVESLGATLGQGANGLLGGLGTKAGGFLSESVAGLGSAPADTAGILGKAATGGVQRIDPSAVGVTPLSSVASASGKATSGGFFSRVLSEASAGDLLKAGGSAIAAYQKQSNDDREFDRNEDRYREQHEPTRVAPNQYNVSFAPPQGTGNPRQRYVDERLPDYRAVT